MYLVVIRLVIPVHRSTRILFKFFLELSLAQTVITKYIVPFKLVHPPTKTQEEIVHVYPTLSVPVLPPAHAVL